ncbi:MAG: hypothetical protein BWY21_00679 [Parcubacteria group bacterium ADurb.Bin216]|nr:MAG: hypothetical protein BWY21_00679 [Parcubacteria group bacterium ADurb.Bin216]
MRYIIQIIVLSNYRTISSIFYCNNIKIRHRSNKSYPIFIGNTFNNFPRRIYFHHRPLNRLLSLHVCYPINILNLSKNITILFRFRISQINPSLGNSYISNSQKCINPIITILPLIITIRYSNHIVPNSFILKIILYINIKMFSYPSLSRKI